MIRKLHINNYKSLFDLTIEVGRFNVFIGENGSGKSNLLEAITLAAAAAADKLDNEFLASRGIRVTEPELMRSAFSNDTLQEPIKIGVEFYDLDVEETYTLNHDNQAYAEWIRSESFLSMTLDILMYRNIVSNYFEDAKQLRLTNSKQIISLSEKHTAGAEKSKNIAKELLKSYAYNEQRIEFYLDHYPEVKNNEAKLKTFLIYSPENSALRNFQKEGQIEPLGINGEGLLKLLKVIQSKSDEQRLEIHTCLELFDWYAEMDIPKELSSYEDKVTITDRYLSRVFDQRSANEGFLFVLFYIALIVSEDTPKIFAIDNIDVALNPKLCTKLIIELVRLATNHGKQVFVTTHNPAILDGIDLGDDEQRLFVVSRNKQGHTRFKRIELKDKPRSSTNEPLKLSEAFLRGYLGGLPKGF